MYPPSLVLAIGWRLANLLFPQKLEDRRVPPHDVFNPTNGCHLATFGYWSKTRVLTSHSETSNGRLTTSSRARLVTLLTLARPRETTREYAHSLSHDGNAERDAAACESQERLVVPIP